MSPRILLSSLLLVLPIAAHAEPRDEAPTPFPCIGPDSEIVGYRKCTAYGAWSLEPDERPVFVAYGTTWRHFGNVAIPEPARAPRTTEPTSSQAPNTKSIDALVIVERGGVALSPGSYAAFEIEMGNFLAGADADSHDIIIGGLGLFGVRGDLGALGLGAELGLGYRGYSEPDTYDLSGELVVEARARADLWVTPWFTIGAVIGTSLRRHDDRMMGVTLGFHTQAYAGSR